MTVTADPVTAARPGPDRPAPAGPAISAASRRLGLVDLLARVTAEAPRRDTDRLLYDDLLPQLRTLRIGAIRLPRSDGTRLRLTEFYDVVRDLATADSNLAHSLRNHYNTVENHLHDPTPSSPRILALAREGRLLFGAAQEHTGSSGPTEGTQFERQPDGTFLLTGRRFYSTGSIYADDLVVGVTLDDGSTRSVLIEADRRGVGLPDDWEGFGQKLTGSGSTVFDHVRVTEADFVDRPVSPDSAPRYPFTFNQTYLTTVVAGIANRALADAVEIARTRTRNYYHGTTDRVRDEPTIQSVIGVASAKAFAATATAAAAAAELERSWEDPRDLDASLAATLAATRAKITVETLALDVVDALTQVAGGSTLSTGRALDRHWRNIKVLASHNPAIYKHRILGAYELNGTTPPLGIYF